MSSITSRSDADLAGQRHRLGRGRDVHAAEELVDRLDHGALSRLQSPRGRPCRRARRASGGPPRNSPRGAAAMTVRLAAVAPATPPDTGASTTRGPVGSIRRGAIASIAPRRAGRHHDHRPALRQGRRAPPHRTAPPPPARRSPPSGSSASAPRAASAAEGAMTPPALASEGERGRVQVEALHDIAGFQQVQRHGQAHGAEADEADRSRGILGLAHAGKIPLDRRLHGVWVEIP